MGGAEEDVEVGRGDGMTTVEFGPSDQLCIFPGCTENGQNWARTMCMAHSEQYRSGNMSKEVQIEVIKNRIAIEHIPELKKKMEEALAELER